MNFFGEKSLVDYGAQSCPRVNSETNSCFTLGKSDIFKSSLEFSKSVSAPWLLVKHLLRLATSSSAVFSASSFSFSFSLMMFSSSLLFSRSTSSFWALVISSSASAVAFSALTLASFVFCSATSASSQALSFNTFSDGLLLSFMMLILVIQGDLMRL